MNKVIMIGNLAKDPDVRTTGTGISVCTLRIAVTRKRANQNGEKVSDFFDVIAWRQLAELCGKYLAKGRKICVTGELQTRSYDAKDGSKRYVTEIVADDIEFLSPAARVKAKVIPPPPMRLLLRAPRRPPPKDLPISKTTNCPFRAIILKGEFSWKNAK